MDMNFKGNLLKITSASVVALGLFIGQADAADPADGVSWTGFYLGGYIGANHGYAFDGTSSNDFDGNRTAFTAGLSLGGNYQLSDMWVIGIEGDVGWGGLEWGGNDANHAFDLDVLSSIRARTGVSIDNHLLYVTAGAGLLNIFAASSSANQDNSEASVRAALGVGVESMLTDSISLKVEGLYFPGKELVYYDSSANDGGTLKDVWSIRTGINFHF